MDHQITGISPEFSSRIASVFGDAGIDWLERLPQILQQCAEEWSLSIGATFPLSYNYVVEATLSDGGPAVLKVCVPNPEAATEMEALRLFKGDGVCRMLRHSAERSAMLLERVQPGEPLTRLALHDDQQATAVAIELFPRIWRTAPENHPFPAVAGWARGIERHRTRFGGAGPLPSALFDEGAECFGWLLATATQEKLLHGDLHHDNILSATREPWLVIDPKGVVGDPGYELGAFLYNPIPELLNMPDPGRVIARRVDQLAEGLGMDRARVRGWGLAQAVLSACWSVEGGEDWRHAMTCAGYLADLRN